MSITFFTDANREGVNLSNANACEVLRTLGFVDEAADPWGHDFISSATLAIRCIDALAAIEAMPEFDPARAATVDARPGRATWIECGRDAGYLRMRIEQLLELARTGLEVWFG